MDGGETPPVDIGAVEVRRLDRHAGDHGLEEVGDRLTREIHLDIGVDLVEKRLHRPLGIPPSLALAEIEGDLAADIGEDVLRLIGRRDGADRRRRARLQEPAPTQPVPPVGRDLRLDRLTCLVITIVHDPHSPFLGSRVSWREAPSTSLTTSVNRNVPDGSPGQLPEP